DIVTLTAVLPAMEGQGLVTIIQVEDVEVLAGQAASLSRQVAPKGDQIMVHLNNPLKLRVRRAAEIDRRPSLEAEGAGFQHLLSVKNHRNSRCGEHDRGG